MIQFINKMIGNYSVITTYIYNQKLYIGLVKCSITLTLTLLSSLFITGFSQGKVSISIDSLHQLIKNTPEDTVKVNRLLLLSDYLLKSAKKEEASAAVDKAKQLAESLEFTDGLARALLQRSQLQLASFDYTTALTTANEAFEIYQRNNNNSGITKALFLIARIYGSQSAHDDAIETYKQVLDLAEKNGDVKTVADAQLQIASEYNHKGLSVEGRFFSELAKASYKSIGHHTGLSMVYNSFGESYRKQSRYTEALENYYQGLKIAEEHELTSHKAIILNNIGLILIQQAKLKEAIDTYLELIMINKTLGDEMGVAYNNNNVGLAYAEMGEYEKAIQFYREGLETNKTVANKRVELTLLYNIGESYMFLNKNKLALQYFKKSYQISKETANEEAMTYGLNGLGLVHIHLREFDKAASYLDTARTIALRGGYKDPLMENYQNMVKLDSMQHNYSGVFEWYKKFDSLEDSINNELKSKQITEIHAQYKSEKKDKEILQLNQAKELEALRHGSERKLFGVIVLFLVLLAIGLIYVVLKRREVNRVLRTQKREIQEQNNELNHVNEEIRTTLETVEQQNKMLHDKNIKLQQLHREKDGLIGVVAHDLRSPIAKAQGLAELTKNAGPLNEKQLEFNNLIKSVCKNGMRLIEDLLMLNMAENTAITANYTTINFNKFLTDLARNYQTAADQKNITLHYSSQVPEQFQGSSDRDYLIRIIDNLMSNAIKFTFPYHAVYLDVINANDHIIFKIRDEGQGMNEEDKSNLFQKFKKLSARPTAGETSTGLGLSIVKTLVTKLNGKIAVKSEEGKGTTFTVKIPVIF